MSLHIIFNMYIIPIMLSASGIVVQLTILGRDPLRLVYTSLFPHLFSSCNLYMKNVRLFEVNENKDTFDLI